MASAEHHVVNILVAMSSDQENDGPNATNSNSRSDGKFADGAKKAAVKATVAPTAAVAKANEKAAATAKTDVDRRILATLSTLPTNDSSTNNSAGSNPSFLGLSWEKGYASLKRFKEKHGHCHVPYRYAVDKSLGTWTARQRKEKDTLAPVQIQLLDAIGFTWQSAQDRVWNEKYVPLSLLLQSSGSC